MTTQTDGVEILLVKDNPTEEVLRRIKSDERTKSIPVAVATSSKEDRDVLASYELGVNSYISKPVDFDEFTRWYPSWGSTGYPSTAPRQGSIVPDG